MILVDVRDLVRAFYSSGWRPPAVGSRLAMSVYVRLRRSATPGGAIGALVAAAEFKALLGETVDLEAVDESGARLVVDGEVLAFGYDGECAPPGAADPAYRDCGIIVRTDYEKYAVYVRSDSGTELAFSWEDPAAEFEESLKYHGGLVRLAKNAEWTLISRTAAIDLPVSNILANEHFEWRGGDSRASRRIERFVAGGGRLKSILRVHAELFPHSEEQAALASRRDSGARMNVLRPALSATLDYTGTHAEAQRGDFVSTYVTPGGTEWCREFLVDRRHDGDFADDLRLLEYNLLYLMGIRRTKLFREKYGRRLYTIILPSAVLTRDEVPTLVAVPLLSLSRLPNSTRFRSTVGLTVVVVPVEPGPGGRLKARKPSITEVGEITQDLARAGTVRRARNEYGIRGPLAGHLGMTAPAATLAGLLSGLAVDLAVRACGAKGRRLAASRDAAVKGLRQSSVGSVCYLVDWPGGTNAPWAGWCAGEDDRVFERVLHRAVFLTDHMSPAEAFSTSETVDFRSLSVGNAHGADMLGLTLYNPQEGCKYVLYPRGSERYPNHSILRWFAWQVYLDVAFASVRALLGRFHDNIDTTNDLRRVLRAAQNLSTELSEVYDLDLADFFYRREYETLRSIMHMDADYEYMRTRMTTAQGESSLREQMLMNNLVLALTLSSVFATLVVAAGEADKWKAQSYLYGAVGTVVGSLLISFCALGPLRKISSRIWSWVAGRRQ
ncbi:hypothetical protein GCM10023085_20920 [Actinomadura viridis]